MFFSPPPKAQFLYKNRHLFIYLPIFGVCVCMGLSECHGNCATIPVWRSGKNVWDSVLSFYHVDLQVSGLVRNAFTHVAILPALHIAFEIRSLKL